MGYSSVPAGRGVREAGNYPEFCDDRFDATFEIEVAKCEKRKRRRPDMMLDMRVLWPGNVYDKGEDGV